MSRLVNRSALEQRSPPEVTARKRRRVDIYLRLELHHVGFDFHVGFIQLLDFMIQMLRVFVVVDT